MYNWSTDIQRLKQNPTEYKKWKLTQQINFGLKGKKLNLLLLKKYLSVLSIDEDKRSFLNHVLYG